MRASFVLALLLSCVGLGARGEVRWVDTALDESGDGTTPETAFATLEDAVYAAGAGEAAVIAVEVPAGGEAPVRFDLPREAFATVDEEGVRAVRPGRYVVAVADCAPVPCALASGRTAPVSFELEIR